MIMKKVLAIIMLLIVMCMLSACTLYTVHSEYDSKTNTLNQKINILPELDNVFNK